MTPAANYYYGLANVHLGNIADARDGFDLAALGMEYRNAAYTELSKIYFRQKDYKRTLEYSNKSLDFNRYNLDAFQLKAIMHRLQQNKNRHQEILDSILAIDPLNHFARCEKYLIEKNDATKQLFVSLVRNELPHQTFLELAVWYHNVGLDKDASRCFKCCSANTGSTLLAGFPAEGQK
jgi:tetratricopeptide (TPR) repeat protein